MHLVILKTTMKVINFSKSSFKSMQTTATQLSLMFFILICILHVPSLITRINVEQEWTNLFVPLAMSGIALLTAGSNKY